MELPDKSSFEQFGFISKLHGKDGGVVLNLYSETERALEKTDYLFVDIHGQIVPFFLIHDKLQLWGAKRYIVHFEEVSNEAQAIELLNKEVYLPVPRKIRLSGTQTVSEDADLSGYTVVDQHLGNIGTITTIHYDKMQGMLEVEKKGKPVLIPVADEFLVRLDENARQLWVNLPDGLIELND